MANVHGFRDLSSNNQNSQPRQNANYGRGYAGYNQPQNNEGYNSINDPDEENLYMGLIAIQPSGEDPRKESFFDMLKNTCCPNISWSRVIVILTIVQIIYYFISLILTYMSKQGQDPGSDFLQPNIVVLNALGMKYSYLMQQGEIWRFVTPIFLHGSFLHIFFNVIAQLIYSEIQIVLKWKKTLLLFIGSGMGGILFTALCNDKLSVGASTSILGILGARVAFLYVYWRALERYGFYRCCFLFQLFMWILMCFMIGLGFSNNIDNLGHLGGLLTGFFLGIALFTPLRNEHNAKKVRIASAVIVSLYFVIGLLCFYLTRDTIDLNIPKPKF